MRSQFALIGMNIQKPQLNLRTTRPSVNIETTQPKITMQSTQPKVLIDQTECFADAGIKSPERMTNENAQRAKQIAQENIAKVAQHGDQLSNIHLSNDDSVIADQAEYNAFTQFEHEYGYGVIPMHRPKFTPIKGELNIDVQKGSINVDYRKGNVENNFIRGKVETYLRQKNSLEISVVNDKFDLKV
ncbi:DUF6470 family protein [Clostridiaceae bacterium HSG29]|nr:DUF6470 family protein [Clostridiaceae bacterium HSG29]